MKTNFLVANWKMNKSFKDGSNTVNSINKKIRNTKKKSFIILPSDPSILFIKNNIEANSVLLGGQNCSAYDKGAYNFDMGLNPNVSDSTNLRKVIRGGSWKDIAYFLRVSARDYEYKDEKRSYIGFRTVHD